MDVESKCKNMELCASLIWRGWILPSINNRRAGGKNQFPRLYNISNDDLLFSELRLIECFVVLCLMEGIFN